MMVKQGKRLATALTAAALAVSGLAACSSSGSGGSSGGGPSGSTIKVGIAVSLTGTSASTNEDAKPGAEAWADYVNANGGIAGHKVEVVVEDTKTSAAAGLAAVKKMVTSEGVAAMLVLDSGTEVAASEYLQQKKVPLLGVGFNQKIYGSLPYVYQPQTSIQAQLQGLPIVGKLRGLKRFGAVVCQESAACAQAGPLLQSSAESAGLSWAGLVTASASQPDYTAQCLQLMQGGTDFIYVGLQPAVGAKFIKACSQQGFKGSFGGSGGSASIRDLSQLPSGTSWLGTLMTFPWFVDTAGTAAYRDAMQKYASDTNYRSFAAASAWSSLQLLAKALAGTQGKDVTPEVVNEAMGTVQNDSLDGLLPSSMTLSATAATAPVKCMWFASYTGGDSDLKLVKGTGDAGNGVTNDLASSCVK